MTALVGVLCRDGVVIGADSSATFALPDGVRSIEQPCMKLDIIDGRVIVAGTGQIGLGQRFCAIAQDIWGAGKQVKGTAIQIAKQLSAQGMNDFASTHVRPGQFGALVAFPTGGGVPALCELQVSDFQPELKTADRIFYCSMGSGQSIMDPFLGFLRSVFWQDGQPSVYDAIFAVVWTLDHAIEVNPGGVNGPARIAVLSRDERNTLVARLLADEDVFEHRQNIEEAKKRLRGLRADQAEAAAKAPDTPT